MIDDEDHRGCRKLLFHGFILLSIVLGLAGLYLLSMAHAWLSETWGSSGTVVVVLVTIGMVPLFEWGRRMSRRSRHVDSDQPE